MVALLVLAFFLPLFPVDAVAQSVAAGLYNEANTHYRRGEYAEARAAYERALENDAEFDYHKSLEQRAKAALERIGREEG